jgi:enoyl-CoA hydratase/carnithine racemase
VLNALNGDALGGGCELMLASDLGVAARADQELLAPVFASRDAEEGRRAFVEKRNPVWRGE